MSMKPMNRPAPDDDFMSRRGPTPAQQFNMAIFTLRKLRVADHHIGMCNLDSSSYAAIAQILEHKASEVKKELHELIESM